MKLLAEDVVLECQEEAKALWWEWAQRAIIRGVQRGFAEWYKLKLAEAQFQPKEETCETFRWIGAKKEPPSQS